MLLLLLLAYFMLNTYIAEKEEMENNKINKKR